MAASLGDSLLQLDILFIILVSATIHPVWNLLIKKNRDPQLGFLFLSGTIALCALAHSLMIGADFVIAFAVLPIVVLSISGQFLNGICLTATLKRGDLSAYYPIIRSSPVFIVLVGVVLFGASYSFAVLMGIALVVIGGILLLYRRGSHILEDKPAVVFALLAMCGTGIYAMANASLVQTIAPSVLVFVIDGTLTIIYGAIWLRRQSVAPAAVRIHDLSPWLIILPGILAYASSYLILVAFQWGGDVAVVTTVRQISIPISVALGGLFLREGAMARRFAASGLMAVGIVLITLSN
jgi:uncharacterized membrane protein